MEPGGETKEVSNTYALPIRTGCARASQLIYHLTLAFGKAFIFTVNSTSMSPSLICLSCNSFSNLGTHFTFNFPSHSLLPHWLLISHEYLPASSRRISLMSNVNTAPSELVLKCLPSALISLPLYFLCGGYRECVYR